ncbi:YceI family protein (plasmid) [Rhodococcoides fascians A21d2]|uniref:YceI family protein n=1 Tax=Rhodococcoides fascians TaxID=1828 RepID=UPI000689F334|nr:YceI family protein [Rhodococcus fascians]QII03679.1 YceI family protein [Rhodococcus fascians A21d2]
MTEYSLDPATAELRFRARGLWGALPVSGNFGQASGRLTLQKEATGTIEIRIDAASVDTGNTLRDRHLRAEDFLHTSVFPTITFLGDVSSARGGFRLTGLLTVRGRAVPHTLEVTSSEDGQTIIGLASTTIDLNSFDIFPPLRMTRRDVRLTLRGSFRSE